VFLVFHRARKTLNVSSVALFGSIVVVVVVFFPYYALFFLAPAYFAGFLVEIYEGLKFFHSLIDPLSLPPSSAPVLISPSSNVLRDLSVC